MRPASRALGALAFLLLPSGLRAEVQLVEFTGGAFVPAVLTVAAGDTLRVVNRDGVPHTLTADDGSYDSGRLMDGDATQIVLADVGTQGFRCTLGGQRVTVHVEEGRGAVRRGTSRLEVVPPQAYTHRAANGPLALGEPVFFRGGR